MKKKILLIVMMAMMCLLPIEANSKKNVKLSKYTDGDTAHFLIDGKDKTVRFLAINAPEYTKEKEPFGKEASEYVCNTLTNAKKIQLEFDDGSDETDKYGRVLAWVYADGKLLQRELVKQGLAEVKYIYGDYAYTDELKELEKEAKAKKLAMWSNETTKEDDTMPYYLSAAGGVVLIIIGTFFAKGKRNKKKMIKQGMKQLKRK